MVIVQTLERDVMNNLDNDKIKTYGTGDGRFTLEDKSLGFMPGRYELTTRLSTDGTFRAALSRLPQMKSVYNFSHVSGELTFNPAYSFREAKKAIAGLVDEMVERQTGLKQYTRRYVIDPTSRNYVRLSYQADVDKGRIKRLIARLKADEGVRVVNEYDLEFTVFFHKAYVAEQVRANVLQIIEHTLNCCERYLKV